MSVYTCARKALVVLGADEDTLAKYLVLTKVDCRADTAIVDPNVPGSRSATMSWIWKMQESQSSVNWIEESESNVKFSIGSY